MVKSFIVYRRKLNFLSIPHSAGKDENEDSREKREEKKKKIDFLILISTS